MYYKALWFYSKNNEAWVRLVRGRRHVYTLETARRHLRKRRIPVCMELSLAGRVARKLGMI